MLFNMSQHAIGLGSDAPEAPDSPDKRAFIKRR
jgi:hypothetical protein